MLRFAVLCLAGLNAVVARSVDEESPPKWSSLYTVKGVFHLPLNDVQEPFEAWFDIKNNKSRVDYYGGTASVYLHPPTDLQPLGTYRKIFHVTTETQLNNLQCVDYSQKHLENDTPILPLLPEMSHYKLIGTRIVFDIEAFKWQFVETKGGVRNEYTMWIKYEGLGEKKQPIPLRFEKNVYETARGVHSDQRYFEFSGYSTENVDVSAFDVDQDMQCIEQEDEELSYMNPMEFFLHLERSAPVEHHFERFKQKHGRQYASDEEHNERLDIFRENLRYINEHNRAGLSYKMAVNYLADRTDDELAGLLGGRVSTLPGSEKGLPFLYSKSELQKLAAKLPKQFDWRLYGAVTPVKNQLHCGSCWAFASVGVVESALFLRSNRSKHAVQLSEQALIDCSWGFGNDGCDGGGSPASFNWIKKHGLPTHEAYGGYMAENGLCHIENMTNTVFIKDWVEVTPGDEKALKVAIFKHGPIAVAFDAAKSLRFYSSGVYYGRDCNPVKSNHLVLAVGFGELNGEKYWLIKNSWGTLWGINGYFLIASKENNCGIMNKPSYVVL